MRESRNLLTDLVDHTLISVANPNACEIAFLRLYSQEPSRNSIRMIPLIEYGCADSW